MLIGADERTEALREAMTELLSVDEAAQALGRGDVRLSVYYDLGAGHPLLGRRMPDLDLVTASGPLRFVSLLHDARPVLLHLGRPGDLAINAWTDRVPLLDAKYVGTWELPAIGTVPASTAVLIRPDGYVAWVGDGTNLGLRDGLTTWFGPPSSDVAGGRARLNRAKGRPTRTTSQETNALCGQRAWRAPLRPRW